MEDLAYLVPVISIWIQLSAAEGVEIFNQVLSVSSSSFCGCELARLVFGLLCGQGGCQCSRFQLFACLDIELDQGREVCVTNFSKPPRRLEIHRLRPILPLSHSWKQSIARDSPTVQRPSVCHRDLCHCSCLETGIHLEKDQPLDSVQYLTRKQNLVSDQRKSALATLLKAILVAGPSYYCYWKTLLLHALVCLM